MIITIQDLHSVGVCSKGTRIFMKQNGIDYNDFLKNGIDSKTLESTGDAIAIKAVCELKKKTGDC